MTNSRLYLHRSQPAKGKEEEGTGAGRGDAELFRQFLLGDDAAFSSFYGRHTGRLYLYCRKMLNDAASAKDLEQEVWSRVIDMRKNPPSHLGNPVGLVIRIARNLCLDELKSSRVSRRESLESVDLSLYTTPPVHPERTSLEDLALLCLNRLDVTYREPLILHLYCGYSYEEVAGMLNTSPEAIWKRASRARRKLRTMMEKEMKDAEYE